MAFKKKEEILYLFRKQYNLFIFNTSNILTNLNKQCSRYRIIFL